MEDPYELIEPRPQEADDGVLIVAPDATPLEFLQAVYRSPTEPMARRLRAAIEALPFVHPKLAVTVAFDGKTFGERLERAHEHRKLIEQRPK
jgi:hypothetical protein